MTGCGLHVLDALVWLAGPIRQVDAMAFAPKPSPDPRDAVAVLARFASGATGLMATVRASASSGGCTCSAPMVRPKPATRTPCGWV